MTNAAPRWIDRASFLLTFGPFLAPLDEIPLDRCPPPGVMVFRAAAPMAPVSAEPMSEPVDVTTRAVNVEELNPWSMVRIRYCSSARAARAAGRSPVSICRYAAA